MPSEDVVDTGGTTQFNVFAGYAEQVVLPETVKVGENIPIEIHLSAQQRPSLLTGDLDSRWIKDFEVFEDNSGIVGFGLDLWLTAEKPGQTANAVMHSLITGFDTPGQKFLRIYNPVNRSDGGAAGVYKYIPVTVRPSVFNYTYTDYPITVTP